MVFTDQFTDRCKPESGSQSSGDKPWERFKTTTSSVLPVTRCTAHRYALYEAFLQVFSYSPVLHTHAVGLRKQRVQHMRGDEYCKAGSHLKRGKEESSAATFGPGSSCFAPSSTPTYTVTAFEALTLSRLPAESHRSPELPAVTAIVMTVMTSSGSFEPGRENQGWTPRTIMNGPTTITDPHSR